MLPLAAMIAPLVVLAFASPLLNRGLLSPVRVAVLIISTFGIIGYLFRSQINGSTGGGAIVSLDETTARQTAYLFATTTGSLLAGAVTVGILWPRSAAVVRRLQSPIGERGRDVVLFLAAATGPFLVFGYGVSDLWSRSEYLKEFTGTNLLSIASPLVLCAVVALGMVFGAEDRQGRRITCMALVLALATIYFAIGTRQFAIVPAAFAAGVVITSTRTSRWTLFAVACAVTLLLVPIPLYLRDLSYHGLSPYLGSFGDFSYGDVRWSNVLTNVFISFNITGSVAFSAEAIPSAYIVTELNPMPGFMTDWYSIAPSLRINEATPFSGMGEIGNLGTATVVGLWFLLGCALMVAERGVDMAVRRGQQAIAILATGLAALFAASVTQYNLRNSERLLLYSLVLLAAIWFLARRSDKSEGAVTSSAGSPPSPAPRVGV